MTRAWEFDIPRPSWAGATGFLAEEWQRQTVRTVDCSVTCNATPCKQARRFCLEGDVTVYLIHFDTPYKHARHYIGWTPNLERRLRQHRQGEGARLLAVIKDAGITWRLARTWEGGRDVERRLKNWHKARQMCPICRMERKCAS